MSFLKTFFVSSAVLLSILQIFIDSSTANFAAAAWACASVTLPCLLLWRKSVFDRFPISTFAVLALPLIFAWMPLFVCAVDSQQPLEHNLHAASDDFCYLFLTVVCLCGSHWVYQRVPLASTPRFYLNNILLKFGGFQQPSSFSVWAVTAIGLGMLAISIRSEAPGTSGGSLTKMAALVRDLNFAPLMLVFRPRRPGERWTFFKVLPFLLYFLALAVLSVADNARQVLIEPIVGGLLVLMLLIFSGSLVLSGRTARTLLVSVLVLLLIYPAASRFSQAMLVVRRERSTVSTDKLIQDTLSEMVRPSMVGGKTDGGGFTEIYYNNAFLDRASPKVIDNTVVMCEGMGPFDRDKMLSVEGTKALAEVPNPVFTFFNVSFDKNALDFSPGDYERHLYMGSGVGSHVLSSYIGDGAILLGFAYFPILGAFAFLWFWLLDSLALAIIHTNPKSPDQYTLHFQYSPLLLPLHAITLQFFCDPQSMSEFLSLRTFLVPVVLMLILFRTLSKPFSFLRTTPFASHRQVRTV